MKRQLILNKKLYDKDFNFQNKYLCDKINLAKPTIKLYNSDTNFFQSKDFFSTQGKRCKYIYII